MLPTFLIAGAGKAGTTSLYTYLDQHPGTCMSAIKEPDFFSEDVGQDQGASRDAPYRSGQFYRGIGWYESLFSHCSPQNPRGEASGYLARRDAPALIRSFIPDVRLVFILRNPIDRALSHYWQSVRNGERLPPFDDAVKSLHPSIRRYLHQGSYAEHLERFFSQFSGEQILLLIFDDLVMDPRSVVGRTLEHIGVDPVLLDLNVSYAPMNQASVPRSRLLRRVAQRGSRAMKAAPMPPLLEAAVWRVGRAINERNSRPLQDRSMEVTSRLYLRDYFREDIRYIEKRLGRDLSHWC